ncbi:uncharacterized protein DUF721 [Maribacter spongiicola]|uniref:Uncharacterized protein DUF721 n=1 Tax=Maribacter spongiicola TaxID=1206753 RepID=A0A4R7K3L3_9FLAO|nr:DUF721 domain-containing protein [Maribacter spongiicola]TDT44677.1 uncharacterized protein DUF721 [Maribacter spongiicola]
MASRGNDNTSMKDALSAFIQKNKLEKGIDKVDARTAWAKLMGNGVNNYTTEIELKFDTLYVALNSSVLREELSLGKSKIIRMLNEEIGKEVIKKLVLR